VKDFQSVIGREARRQILADTGKLPDEVVACVGGGSNAIGIFSGFVDDADVRLVGVEAGGEGLRSGKHAIRLTRSNRARRGIVQGYFSYFLQDEGGQVAETHSVSAGLDYSGIGPEHAWLHEQGRAEYTYATDKEAVKGFTMLSELEGIIPALESAHAVAYAIKRAPKMNKDQVLLVNLSGRGDKDIHHIADYLGITI
jgi:tryptophan synthase beta chain